ncbi:MAG TPA: hypothetical protein VEF34_09875 [Syntrophobacteraceae bacterium]|nr:hypothetical protein [Syntrophobacteraceae bacterium]
MKFDVNVRWTMIVIKHPYDDPKKTEMMGIGFSVSCKQLEQRIRFRIKTRNKNGEEAGLRPQGLSTHGSSIKAEDAGKEVLDSKDDTQIQV